MEGIWCSLREFGQFKLGRHGANHYQVHPWKCLKFDKTRNVEKKYAVIEKEQLMKLMVLNWMQYS